MLRGCDPLLQFYRACKALLQVVASRMRSAPTVIYLAAIVAIVVFCGAAPYFFCGVFFLVQFELGVDGLLHVDAEFVGQADEVDLDVGDFLFHLGHFFGWQGLALFFGQPLEVFDQFGGLDDEGHGEVLRGVELVPVAFGGEVAEAGFYLVE